MKPTRIIALLSCVALAGCMGQTEQADPDPSTPIGPSPSDPFAPCTDDASCCTAGERVCTGNVDDGVVCKCYKVWDCTNPKKCQAPLPPPPGDGSWSCVWSKSALTCTGGSATKPPTGGGGWTCSKNANGTWTCTQSAPNPSNKPAGTGVWTCVVTNGFVVCDRKDTTPTPTPTPTPPPGKPLENCTDGVDNDGDGLVDCKDPDCPACKPPVSQCPPGKECCDGKDNNGDGRVDEGNVCGGLPPSEPCPPGAIQSCDCYCGVHRKCKPDGTWGACKVDHSCQVAQITTHAQCGAGTYCDFGKCVPSGPSWFGAQCKTHSDCPTGKVCDMEECIVDHYTHNCP